MATRPCVDVIRNRNRNYKGQECNKARDRGSEKRFLLKLSDIQNRNVMDSDLLN